MQSAAAKCAYVRRERWRQLEMPSDLTVTIATELI
jgi:hypothetical protein